MIYKFKVIKPKQSDWIVAEAETFAEAIQQWHYDHVGKFDTWIREKEIDGKIQERQHFALFESDSGEQLISRICASGIYRKGGVVPHGNIGDPLAYVARQLDVSRDSFDDGEWKGEEQY